MADQTKNYDKLVDKFGAFTQLVEVSAGRPPSEAMEPSQEPLGLLKRSAELVSAAFNSVAR